MIPFFQSPLRQLQRLLPALALLVMTPAYSADSSALAKASVNHSGLIEAQTVGVKNGVVELLGDMARLLMRTIDLLRTPTDALYTRSFTQPRAGLRSTWRGPEWAVP